MKSVLVYQSFVGNGEYQRRNCDFEDANKHGDSKVAVTATAKRCGTTSPVQPLKGKETNQIFWNRTPSDQTLSSGTWV